MVSLEINLLRSQGSTVLDIDLPPIVCRYWALAFEAGLPPAGTQTLSQGAFSGAW